MKQVTKLNPELKQAYEDYAIANFKLQEVRMRVQKECKHEWVRQHNFVGNYDYCSKCEKER